MRKLKFYRSASTLSSPVSHLDVGTSETWEKTVQILLDLVLLEDELLLELSKGNIYKSMGPENLSGRVLFELKHEIAKQLSVVFDLSWDTAEVPDDWKRGNKYVIFKNGTK